MNPIVSIILPTFNGGQYIKKAIQSVLKQTYQSWELIIIDDGSYDDTQLIVKDFLDDSRITYVKNEKNLGLQKSLNRGITQSHGKLIARIDDDDQWYDPEKLQKQVIFLDNNPQHVLVGTGVILIDTKEREISRYLLPENDLDIRKRMLAKNCFAHPTVLFRKEALEQVGLYSINEKDAHVEDHELWLRLGTVGKFANIPTYSAMLSVRTTSITGRYRIIQARHMLALAYKYRHQYPSFLKASIICLMRIIFFAIYKYVPLSKKILYTVQARYRQA